MKKMIKKMGDVYLKSENPILIDVEGYNAWLDIETGYCYAYDDKDVYPLQKAKKVYEFER